jgi:hypothetical protein
MLRVHPSRRDVDTISLGARLARRSFERRKPVVVETSRLVEQPFDQRALVVVNTATDDEANERAIAFRGSAWGSACSLRPLVIATRTTRLSSDTVNCDER